MRIFVTGGSGLLGSKLAEIALEKGHQVFSGYNHNLSEKGLPIKFDLAIETSIRKSMNQSSPEIVFHTAALTDVDRCQVDQDLACQINVRGTKILAETTKEAGAFMVYISTDYVFDGKIGMYREEDPTSPVNHYGYTKLMGEQHADCEARTCVIYGSRPASGKVNFALWILERLRKEEKINIVADQYVSPTLNTNLAHMLLDVAERRLEGIWHLAGSTRISRYDFACQLADVFGLDKNLLVPSKMANMSWMAQRPRDSSMDVSKASRGLKEKPYDLNRSLKIVKEEIG
ncbi:MAG: SDR family oxidoreductase [Methanotrichaceae archaeon]|nr:SDR family oxidoreductase [Methanotrichaceae archaeon]